MSGKEPYEIWLRDLEQNDDNNDVARTLFESGLPDGCPRLEALFRRAMRGNGVYSQRLQALLGEPA
jgi:hypothetical protein